MDTPGTGEKQEFIPTEEENGDEEDKAEDDVEDKEDEEEGRQRGSPGPPSQRDPVKEVKTAEF